jgi:hypothetical protein
MARDVPRLAPEDPDDFAQMHDEWPRRIVVVTAVEA